MSTPEPDPRQEPRQEPSPEPSPEPSRAPSPEPTERLVVDDGPLIPTRSADDSDTGWSDHRADSDDDRLLRDVPPHWA